MGFEVVGLDGGNHEIKIWGIGGGKRFLSNIGEYRERRLIRKYSDDDIVFEYDGVKGFAGTLAKHESEFASSMIGDTKAHEEMVKRVLLGLCSYSNGNHFRVVVGQPISMHNEVEKEKMKMLLEGMHEITFNGRLRKIYIEKILICPEGATAYWSNPRSQNCRILDFGSGTINAATILNGGYVDRDSFTISSGLNTAISLDYEAIARIVSTQAMSHKWSKGDEVYLVGGGAENLLIPISRYFPKAQLLRPMMGGAEEVFANAIGFYLIGKELLSDEA